MLTRKKISVVPVAYQDEGNIRELYKRLTPVLKKITPNYEIIYVSDEISETQEKILRQLAKKDKKLTVILHSRNFGAHNAFTSGMKQAQGDAIVIMDGDLQDPPELIEKFVEKWLEGYEVVYGTRRKRERSLGPIKEFIYHWFYLIFNKLSYLQIPADAGEFSLMDRKVVNYINDLPEKDRFIRGLRAWVGFRQIGVSYIRPERFSGKTTYGFFRNFQTFRKAIFSFSYVPLELVFTIAILSSLLSFIAIIFYIAVYFFAPNMPKGFLTLLVAFLFFGSIQLLILSILCQYIRIIFEEVKSRPVSITKEIINNHRSKKG